jgi:hypothetical protein
LKAVLKAAAPMVLRERPPNFDKIFAAFPGAGSPGVIFAYGGFIFAPGDVAVPPEIVAHERVHLERQGYEQDAWWDRYIADPQFRLDEEIVAHRAEYREFARRHGNPTRRTIALQEIAAKLAAPLYGGLISVADARQEILKGAKER